MVTTSDQILADIARTRARMSRTLDQGRENRPVSASGPSSGVGEQIRRNPLAALGLALIAGSVVKDYLGAGKASGQGPTIPRNDTFREADYMATQSPSDTGAPTPEAGQSAGQMASNIVERAVETTRDAAAGVADVTSDVAQSAANTAAGAYSQIADTAEYVAEELSEYAGDLTSTLSEQIRRRPLMALGLALTSAALLQEYMKGGPTPASYSPGSAAYGAFPASPSYREFSAPDQSLDQTASSAVSDAAQQVSETVVDLFPAVSRQVQERPLTAVGMAIASGMFLQPTFRPHISAVTSGLGDRVRTASRSMGELVALPEQPEVNRIMDALVPAAVERARQFTNHQVRDYLNQHLEGVVSKTPMRAGIVAAVTERTQTVVETRLPGILDSVRGVPALVALGLVGAILSARDQAQQGDSPANVRTQLVESIVQSSEEQLSRHFPEFRIRYQAGGSAV